jgi:hypothetical protein
MCQEPGKHALTDRAALLSISFASPSAPCAFAWPCPLTSFGLGPGLLTDEYQKSGMSIPTAVACSTAWLALLSSARRWSNLELTSCYCRSCCRRRRPPQARPLWLSTSRPSWGCRYSPSFSLIILEPFFFDAAGKPPARQ